MYNISLELYINLIYINQCQNKYSDSLKILTRINFRSTNQGCSIHKYYKPIKIKSQFKGNSINKMITDNNIIIFDYVHHSLESIASKN